MLFLILLLYPLMLWGLGILIFRYKPHGFGPYHYEKPSKQNGRTFFFAKWNLNAEEWDIFKGKTKRYFNISAIVSVLICLAISIVWRDDLRMARRIGSIHFIVIVVIVIALAYSQVTAHGDEPENTE